MNEKYKGIRKKGKVVGLLVGASLIVMLTVSLIVALAGAASCPSSPPGAAPRNPGIPSGALCRGACGRDCPSTCEDLPDISICAPDGEHVCKYKVIKCGSHQGCRDHDDCYDACALRSPPVFCPWGGQCCDDCNDNCTDQYGYLKCASWALGNGPYDSWLKFSYPPVQTDCNEKNGWYCNEANDHNYYFDYYCADSKCDSYHITQSKNCNDYDGWHCVGANKRQKWDGYCKVGSALVCEYEVLEEETCGANAHCSGGTCHCDEGYQDCDGDGNCECPPGWWCEEGECVPEASTFVLLGFGLLCVAGYFRLKRKEN